MQIEFAAHDVVQLLPQVPVQVVLFAHWVTHEVPQLVAQVLFLLQSKVMLLGRAVPEETPPSAVEGASAQLAPAAQEHVDAVHEHDPEHEGGTLGPQLRKPSPTRQPPNNTILRIRIEDLAVSEE